MNIQLIEGLNESLTNLSYRDMTDLDHIKRKSEMIIRNVFGKTSKYLMDLRRISFSPPIAFTSNGHPINNDEYLRTWNTGVGQLRNLYFTMIEELKLFGEDEVSIPTLSNDQSANEVRTTNNKIFIVHGHDEVMKEKVARMIEKLDLEAVILHEKENQGRTIIEKFSDYSNVSFSIVLLSPDDIGFPVSSPENQMTRARQNVIFELGYFIGSLGRNRVLALYREDSNFEMPSDYSGVLFIPFDTQNSWQFAVAKELKATGFDIDINKLL